MQQDFSQHNPPAQPNYFPPPAYAQPPQPFGAGMVPQVLSRPGSITAAAIMWIIYGGLSLLGNLLSLGNAHVGMQTFIGFAIAFAFLVGGIQLIGGKARGALGLGITSIILGALVLIACLALGSLVRGMGAASGVLAVIGLIFGGYLIVAGILGCSGNAKYKAWRATTGRY